MIDKPEEPEEKPPLLGSWRNLYWLVAVFLFLQIVVFFLLTQYYQ